MISVIVPVRDRENSRVKRCISYIKKNGDGIVDEIIVVDYGSKIPFKSDKVKVIRVEAESWNKAHSLNLGILQSNSKFIMTVDVDMIVDFKHFSEIITNLKENNFIISTNVRRINKKDISKDYDSMIEKSTGWHSQSRNQYFNQANGGFQVYPRAFFDKIGGIMEGMGKFHRAVDNWVFFMARMNGLTTIDISYPLLHVEHKKQKEEHYDKDIRQQAEAYAIYKAWYIDYMINRNQKENTDSFYGKEKPCEDLFMKFLKEVSNRDKKIQQAINEQKKQVAIAGQTFSIEKSKPRILATVINNKGYLPSYFVWDLFNVYIYSVSNGIDFQIQEINACDVAHMRNLSIKQALQGGFDYVVQLDDDHRYPQHFIVKFIQEMQKNNYDVLTGLTPGKKPPYRNTQYLKFITPIDVEGNPVVCPKPKKEIIQIEASGPVGMVMKTSIFKNLPFPWYNTEYGKKEEEGKVVDTLLGSDLKFSRVLLENNIPMMLDLEINFPHCKEMFLSRGKIIPR